MQRFLQALACPRFAATRGTATEGLYGHWVLQERDHCLRQKAMETCHNPDMGDQIARLQERERATVGQGLGQGQLVWHGLDVTRAEVFSQ